MRLALRLLAAPVLILASPALAQPAAGPDPAPAPAANDVTAVFAEEAPRIDGHMDEALWQLVTPVTRKEKMRMRVHEPRYRRQRCCIDGAPARNERYRWSMRGRPRKDDPAVQRRKHRIADGPDLALPGSGERGRTGTREHLPDVPDDEICVDH